MEVGGGRWREGSEREVTAKVVRRGSERAVMSAVEAVSYPRMRRQEGEGSGSERVGERGGVMTSKGGGQQEGGEEGSRWEEGEGSDPGEHRNDNCGEEIARGQAVVAPHMAAKRVGYHGRNACITRR